MSSLKWRIILCSASVIFALGLNQLGYYQDRMAHAEHPGMFYHGNLYWQAPALTVSDCINAPAVAAWEWIRDVNSRRRWFNDEPLMYYRRGYILCTALFWFGIGWVMDKRSLLTQRTASKRVVLSLLTILSLVLTLMGASQFRHHYGSPYLPPSAVLIAMAIWGAALTAWFVWTLVARKPNRFQ